MDEVDLYAEMAFRMCGIGLCGDCRLRPVCFATGYGISRRHNLELFRANKKVQKEVRDFHKEMGTYEYYASLFRTGVKFR